MMYVKTPPLDGPRALDQGDILGRVLRPGLPVSKNFVLARGKGIEWPVKPEKLREQPLDGALRLQVSVTAIDRAIVISNSCDNASGGPIQLAPIVPFSFRFQEEQDAPRRWEQISVEATGTATPKSFYLPASQLGLPSEIPRSRADLSDPFSVTVEYLQLCFAEAGTSRICGLSDAARRHLQWHIATVYSRDPREDDEWPSDQDRILKVAWLRARVAAKQKGDVRYADFVKELKSLEKRLGIVSVDAESAPIGSAEGDSKDE
jgi:hypothetical protein